MKQYLLIPIFLITSFTVQAQFNYDPPQFKDETIEFIKAPLSWNGNDWFKVGLIGAGSFLIMQADQPIREMMIKDRTYVKSFPMEFGRMYGDLLSPIFFTGVFGLHSLITNDKTTRKIAYEIAQTTFYAGAITTFLKVALSRARPYTENGSYSFFHMRPFDDQYLSFPSGHTTIAFSISTVLANNSKSTIVKILCYLPALLTAVSRVYQDNHWASDVFLGGIIGYTIGSYVTSLHEDEGVVHLSTPQQFSIIIPLN